MDENVSFADLKQTLYFFVQEMFGKDVKDPFPPFLFPFYRTQRRNGYHCRICGGSGCSVCKHTGWVEILGSGMVHPECSTISASTAINITGFAFGMGIERICQLKYRVNDLRLYSQNDVRFLRQFTGACKSYHAMIKTIGVCGAGTMGSGIAQVAAMAGYDTMLYDLDAEHGPERESRHRKEPRFPHGKEKGFARSARGTLGRLSFVHDTAECIADLIIEAIVERPEIKLDLFQRLADINSRDSDPGLEYLLTFPEGPGAKNTRTGPLRRHAFL